MHIERERRIAENESLFRAANERIAAWPEPAEAGATESYFCECANTKCDRKLELRVSDYERVRSKSDRFFVIPGHEVPDVERVIESHEAWLVVEKPAGVEDLLEKTDPRHGG
jgi:hypothetical protein